MKKLYTASLLLLTITFGINANSQNIVSLQNIENESNSLRSSNSSDYLRVIDLIRNLHPKTYIVNGQVISNTHNSYSCEIDINSYTSLLNRSDLSNLEILTVKVHQNDYPNINSNALKTKFSNLKFIYAIYDFETDLQRVTQSFPVVNDDILIIYSISLPD